MADFLMYWKSLDTVEELGDSPLTHIGSEQLKRARVGDFIWLVHGDEGFLLLFNRFLVGTLVSRDEAITRLGTGDLWESEIHALTPEDQGEPIRLVLLRPDVLTALRFESKKDRLSVEDDGYVNFQQLQTMRRLTPRSAALLSEIWETDEGMTLPESLLFGDDDEHAQVPTFVTSVEQIRRAIALFDVEVEQDPEGALVVAQSAKYWIYEPDTGKFAPLKFAGFQDMSMSRYRELGGLGSSLGVEARLEVEKILGPFEASVPFLGRFRAWTQERLGRESVSAWLPEMLQFASLAPGDPFVYLDEEDGDYDPDHPDTREEALRNVRLRRGQQEFRKTLLDRHGRRCAISGCDLVDVLEAAHLAPFRGIEDHRTGNGLLLRADLHTLFDLDLLGIDPRTRAVHVHPRARSAYGHLEGRTLDPSLHLKELSLRHRWAQFQARLSAGEGPD